MLTIIMPIVIILSVESALGRQYFRKCQSKLACFELTCKDKDGYQQRSQKTLPRVTIRLGDTD